MSDDTDFDYIIVGSGAGGGPLAANLALAGFRAPIDGGGRRRGQPRLFRARLQRSGVDGNFGVRGAQGLRVVDASVFPRIPGTFIVLPIYMISEKAAAVIIADARRG